MRSSPNHFLSRRNPAALTGLCTVLFCTSAGAAQIYSNGPLSTGPTSKSGVAAPAGAAWSELQNDNGNLNESNTNLGFAAAAGLSRLADDFTVPAGQVWTIEGIDFYAYLTGSPATPSPITGHTVQVWNGVPAAPGAMVIAGDTVTNVLTSSTDALMFRIGNTVAPPPGSATGTTRRIWRNRVTFAQPIVLQPGTYWLDWDVSDSNANANPFLPPVTVVGARTQPGWNGRQLILANAAWLPLVDPGFPDIAPDVAADMPFELQGSVCGDSIVTAPETCDDGNLISGDGCDSNCTITACGNGILAGDETCDDGNVLDGDGCDSNCTATACGNGILTGAEGCDDGNVVNGDGCDNNCTATACGNGILTAPEQCDDGNVLPADGCESDCTLTDGVACVVDADCPSTFCVDGVCCDAACGGNDLTDCQACSVANGATENGTCGVISADTVCRAAAGECDAAEACDGLLATCPADLLADDGTACADGTCELGICVPPADTTTGDTTTGDTTTGDTTTGDTTTGDTTTGDTTTGDTTTTGDDTTTGTGPTTGSETLTGEPTTTSEPTTTGVSVTEPTTPGSSTDTPTSASDPSDGESTDTDSSTGSETTDDEGCGCRSSRDTWPTALMLPWLVFGATRRRRPRS